MQPYLTSPTHTSPYNHNTYGNTYGYIHDVSGVDITNDIAQYLGLDMNTMSFGGKTQVGDALKTALHSAVARHQPVSYLRWNLLDPDQQLGPLSQNVQKAAAYLRTSAFHVLHDTCKTTQCHYEQVSTLQKGTNALEESLDALAGAYHNRNQTVPTLIADRLQKVHQMNARISTAHDQAAHNMNTVDVVTESDHMDPLISTLRDIGELTRKALPPEQEVNILRAQAPIDWTYKHTDLEPHARAKMDALQAVRDPSLTCILTPIMCHSWQRFDISPCHSKRQQQLRAGCAHQAGCHVVSCDLNGQFHVQQPDMKCVDPITGEPTGYDWSNRPCPGHVKQLMR